jgi:hypothetical protein
VSLDDVQEDILNEPWSPETSVLHRGMLSPGTDRDMTGFLDDSQDNQYSIEIETLLVGNKLNGGLSPRDAFPAPSQLLVQLCKVTQITTMQKVSVRCHYDQFLYNLISDGCIYLIFKSTKKCNFLQINNFVINF